MDSKELRGLCEAYTAVYDEDLRDELEEMSDEFAGIENLSDEEIDAIVEETIDEMLEEGYDFDEVEEIFEEVLSEAARGMDRAAARREYMRSSEAAAKEARKRGAAVVKKEKRAEKIAKVKGAVKSALGKAKEAVKSGVSKAKEAGKEAKFRAVDKPVAAYATKRNLHPAAGMAARSKDPAKRRALRSKVASDIKGRIQKKIAQAQVGAYNTARKAGQAASDAAGRAKQSAKNLAARTGRGIKSAVGKAARKVATGAGKVASRLGEDVDVYDIVLEHLIENGYAESYEAAEKIMVNMSEEWRDWIIKEAQYTPPPQPQQPPAEVRKAPKKAPNPMTTVGTGLAAAYVGNEIGKQLLKKKPVKGVFEEVDIYDIILSHLLDEAFADTIESAEAIMVNMSEEWRDEIIGEAYVDYRKGKLPSGRTPQTALKSGVERAKVNASREQRAGGSFGTTATPSWKRSKKAGAVGDEMDANTSFGGKVNKVVNLGRRDNAGPSVQRGEPNTARHQQAIDAREKRSRG